MGTDTVYCLLPELTVIGTATLIFVAGAFFSGRVVWSWLAVAGLAFAGLLLYRQYASMFWPSEGGEPLLVSAVRGPLAIDLLSQYIRWLVLAVGVLYVMISAGASGKVQAPEFVGTLLLAVAGLMLVASANELALLFVSLELISIPTYVLLYLGRKDQASQEATTKYFFLSILSSALLLYGFSFLYGAAGSTQLPDVRLAFAASSADQGGRLLGELALLLVFAGLAFKMAAVPFHFYAPDVYQGTTNGNAGLLAVLPKVAGVVALVRIVAVAMPGLETFGWRLALILSLVTMTLGNVVALWQTNVRRLLAYSSIAHSGYLLIGLAVGFATAGGADAALGFDGIGATLFYSVVYVLATTGAFATLAYLGRHDKQIDDVDELAGLGHTHPLTALAMSVFMFSLAGIPPLAGFWGKFTLFGGALAVDAASSEPSPVRIWFLILAAAAVLNAAISAAYYLRIVAAMYFKSPTVSSPAQGGLGAAGAMLLCAVGVILVGLFPDPVSVGANSASRAARVPAPSAPVVAANVPAIEDSREASHGQQSMR